MKEMICRDKNGDIIECFMQWDQNQYLYIYDLEIDADNLPLAQFSNINSSLAFSVGEVNGDNEGKNIEYVDGILKVKVPNAILTDNKMISVFLYDYDYDTNSGKCIYYCKIPVYGRIQPDDFIFEEHVNYVVLTEFKTEYDNFEKFVRSEITRIDDDISEEASTRETADGVLQNNINIEASARSSSDATLQDNIDTEKDAREKADKALNDRIDTEEKARIDKDKLIDEAISAEISTRGTADSTLDGKIADEAETRSSNDKVLQGNIDKEATARSSEDGLIRESISTLDEKVVENINRIDKDIDALEERAEFLEERMSDAEDAINILNGNDEGSVNKKINDAFNDFATKISDDNVVNTYKELVDYAAEHKGEAATMAGNISKNTDAISEIVAYIGTIPKDIVSVTGLSTVAHYVEYEATRLDEVDEEIQKAVSNNTEQLRTIDSRISTAKEDAISSAVSTASADATTKANTAEQNAKDYANKTFITTTLFDETLTNYSTTEESSELYAAKISEHEHENQEVLNTITNEKVAMWDNASGDPTTLFTSIFNAVYPVGSIYMATNNTDPSILFGGTWESWGNGRVPVGVDTSQTEFSTVELTGGSKEIQSHDHSFTPSGSIGNTTAKGSISSDKQNVFLSSATATGTIGSTTSTMQNAGDHKHSVPHSADCSSSGSKVRMIGYSGDGTTSADYTNRYTANGGSHTHTMNSHTHTFTGVAHNHDVTTSEHSHTFTGSEHNHTFTGNTGTTDTSGTGASGNLQPYITCYMWKRLTLAS